MYRLTHLVVSSRYDSWLVLAGSHMRVLKSTCCQVSKRSPVPVESSCHAACPD